MAEQDQQAFFVDDELVERLLRGDAPLPSKATRPAAAGALADAVQQATGGRLEEAAKTLESAAQQGQDPGEVYSALGHVRFEQQLWEEAAECYRKVAALAGPQPTAHYNLGLVLERQGKFNDAAAAFEVAAEQNPKLWQAFAGMGTCFLYLGNWERAIQSLDAALRQQPDHVRTQLGKAVALEAKASELLAKNDFAAAAQHYLQATKLRPDSFEAWFNLGVSYQRSGRFDQAAVAYTEAIRLQPASAEAHANLGAALEGRGERAAATEAYLRALTHSPEMPGVLWNMAISADQSRQSDRAVEYFARLVKIAPGFEDAAFRLGFLQLQRGEYADASRSFEICVAQRSNWTEALSNLGLAYWKSENLEGAENAFENVRAIDPKNADAMRALLAIAVERRSLDSAWNIQQSLKEGAGFENIFNLGLALQQAGRHEQSADCYRLAIGQSPGFTPALLNLGHALNTLGRDEEARAAWARAIEADPQLAAGYFSQA